MTVLVNDIVQRRNGEAVQRSAVVLIGQTHVDIAIQTHAMPAQAVIHRRGRLDHRLVRQIGSHRFREIPARQCGLGLRYRPLLLKLLLTFLEIREPLRQCLVLFAKLFRLSLYIRELVGAACHRESQDGSCRDKSSSHVSSPKSTTQIIRKSRRNVSSLFFYNKNDWRRMCENPIAKRNCSRRRNFATLHNR